MESIKILGSLLAAHILARSQLGSDTNILILQLDRLHPVLWFKLSKIIKILIFKCIFLQWKVEIIAKKLSTSQIIGFKIFLTVRKVMNLKDNLSEDKTWKMTNLCFSGLMQLLWKFNMEKEQQCAKHWKAYQLINSLNTLFNKRRIITFMNTDHII